MVRFGHQRSVQRHLRRRFPIIRKKLTSKRILRRALGMGQMGRRFFKLRQEITVTASATVINNTYTNDPSSQQDWGSCFALFDSYKVAAIRLKFVPNRPNDPSSSSSYAPLYIVGDVDTTAALASVNAAIQYENMKVVNMYRPWKYYWKIPTRSQSATAGTMLAGGYKDTAVTTADAAILTYGTGFTNQSYGSVIITHYIVFKNRR